MLLYTRLAIYYYMYTNICGLCVILNGVNCYCYLLSESNNKVEEICSLSTYGTNLITDYAHKFILTKSLRSARNLCSSLDCSKFVFLVSALWVSCSQFSTISVCLSSMRSWLVGCSSISRSASFSRSYSVMEMLINLCMFGLVIAWVVG